MEPLELLILKRTHNHSYYFLYFNDYLFWVYGIWTLICKTIWLWFPCMISHSRLPCKTALKLSASTFFVLFISVSTHFHALATCFLSLVQLSCCFIFECRIHVTDDDVVHWKQNNVTPTLTIDSMRDLLRVFINGQVAGSCTRLLHTFCT